MKYTLLTLLPLLFCSLLQAQYTEDWSDPVPLTDSSSFNANPVTLVFETVTYLFYEKKLTEDGPVKIYYRDIKNMGDEMELLGDEVYSFRNPVIIGSYYPNPDYCLLYESDLEGNFDIYALPFDEFMEFGDTYQLTFSVYDDNNVSHSNDYGYTSWDMNGHIMAASLVIESDTVFLQNTTSIDSPGAFDPQCCAFRITYSKLEGDSISLYYCDWNFSQAQWSDPVVIDTTGNNTHCHCSMDMGYYFFDNILYEKEGLIYNYHNNDELYELVLPDYYGDTHEPHSAFYSIPVDYLPMPLFVTFSSEADGYKDIYVYWTESGGEPVANLTNDSLINSNPQLSWGWYASGPCSRYFLDIWQTEKNGYQILYMSKCALYVCGSTDENSWKQADLEVSPNPFKSHLTIRFNAKHTSPVLIELIGSSGQLVYQQLISSPEYGWNEVVFSPGLNTGKEVLYLTVKQGKDQLFRKVIYY